MAKSNASGLLTSLDSLFTTQEQRDAAKRDVVLDLPLDQIGDFPNHPFKVRQDEAMMEMMKSVQLHGVLVPGLVRQLVDGSYQMVSGHRRKLASRLAGLDTLPCIVRDLTDDEAVIIMVDSNLQRDRVLPSEKAFAYKMKLDAMRRQQGERTDLTSAPVGQKFDGKTSRELLAIESPDSHSQIQRYIRLTNLIPEILDMRAIPTTMSYLSARITTASPVMPACEGLERTSKGKRRAAISDFPFPSPPRSRRPCCICLNRPSTCFPLRRWRRRTGCRGGRSTCCLWPVCTSPRRT